MSTYFQRRAEVIELLQVGAIPMELKDAALLAIEEEPPKWRVLKHRRWLQALDKIFASASQYRSRR